MVKVELAREARDQFDALPLPIKGRVANVLERLHKWPAVSGAKALTGELKGNYRIRTGDYRVIFVSRPRTRPSPSGGSDIGGMFMIDP